METGLIEVAIGQAETVEVEATGEEGEADIGEVVVEEEVIGEAEVGRGLDEDGLKHMHIMISPVILAVFCLVRKTHYGILRCYSSIHSIDNQI